MSRVLLLTESPKIRYNYINTLPPLGILGIASFLESRGVETDVIDYNISPNVTFDPDSYDCIGLSVHCANIERTLERIGRIRKTSDTPVLVGGPHTKTNPDPFLQRGADVAVGEGEHTFYEYLKRKDKGKVKGLYLHAGGKRRFTGERPWITDLDSLPFPALDKVDLKKYNVPLKQAKPISSMMSSRGCPFNCIFCFHSLGNRWRYRSAKNVVDEIEWQTGLGVREICMFDDNFTLDLKRAEKICDLIIEQGIDVKIQFTNGIRVDRVNRRLLEKLKRAGFWLVGVAPETGNRETLKKIKKGFTLEKVEEVVNISKELGFITHSYFMVGFPWETRRHIEDTINFADKLDTDITQFTRVLPFPNTELFEMMDLEVNKRAVADAGLFYGNVAHPIRGISDEEIHRLIKQGYRRCFFKPKKMLKLAKTFSPFDLFALFVYSITSESI